MPSLVIGTILVLVGFLGMFHLAGGLPTDPVARRDAGGALGYLSGGFLAQGLTSWVAGPLLVLIFAYGVLLLVHLPVREVPGRLGSLLMRVGALSEDNLLQVLSRQLGLPVDGRDYREAAQVLIGVGVRSIRLLNLKGCTDPQASNYKTYFVKSDNSTCRYGS